MLLLLTALPTFAGPVINFTSSAKVSAYAWIPSYFFENEHPDFPELYQQNVEDYVQSTIDNYPSNALVDGVDIQVSTHNLYEGWPSPSSAGVNGDWNFGQQTGDLYVTSFGYQTIESMQAWPYEGEGFGEFSFNLTYEDRLIAKGSGLQKIYFLAESFSEFSGASCYITVDGNTQDCYSSFDLVLGQAFDFQLHLSGSAVGSSGNFDTVWARYDLTQVGTTYAQLPEISYELISESDLQSDQVPEPSTFLLSLLPLAVIGYRKASRKNSSERQ